MKIESKADISIELTRFADRLRLLVATGCSRRN